ncbi:MAG: galactitol-1-phosphate 5-dehydrogenase [Deltaproteobacteria bacterium]|jgi:L-iditol 2-dehydrogenase|nr:galactitol-1-phosphate 5-dehydrogenase [Deltaproteobacteria bacterium]
MKALVLRAKETLLYEDIPTPTPGPYDVLIKVRCAGICGSDVPRVNQGAAHFFPIVLGHEFSGIIASFGSEVEGLRAGMKATAAPLVPCFVCEDCQRGNFSLCQHYSFIGSSRFGAFGDFALVPARNIVTFPSNVSFEEGAFFEPATVSLHGLLHSGFRPGRTVAILGCGTVGLFALQWARLLGAKKIAAFDIEESRLNLAIKFGADQVFNTTGRFLEAAMQFCRLEGYEEIFETAGQNETMALAFDLAANKANICFIGTSSKDLSFGWKTFEKMNRKEFSLTGSWMSYSAPFPGKEWTMTAEYFGNGSLKFDPELIYKSYPMEKGAQAFEDFKTPGLVKGKILLVNPE